MQEAAGACVMFIIRCRLGGDRCCCCSQEFHFVMEFFQKLAVLCCHRILRLAFKQSRRGRAPGRHGLLQRPASLRCSASGTSVGG